MVARGAQFQCNTGGTGMMQAPEVFDDLDEPSAQNLGGVLLQYKLACTRACHRRLK
jgi:hypothetical protein